MGIFDTYEHDFGKATGHYYIIGRVKKIVLGAYLTDSTPNPDYDSERDLGAIYFEALYSNKSGYTGDGNYSKPAYPMFGFLRQYPNVGEIVLIFPGPSPDLNDNIQNQDLWYLPSFAVWNSVHHNVFPNMNEYSSYLKNVSKDGFTGPIKPEMPKIPQGYTFQEIDAGIRSLRPFEGDTILQGRWGQSVRMGSTVSELKKTNSWSSGKDKDGNSTDGKPITIILNQQRKLNTAEETSPVIVEDINRDGSAIYLTAGQIINIIDLSNFPHKSYSLDTSLSEQEQVTLTVETIPISNEMSSASSQDEKSLNMNQESFAGRALVNRGDVG
jgi:hypothetical protein